MSPSNVEGRRNSSTVIENNEVNPKQSKKNSVAEKKEVFMAQADDTLIDHLNSNNHAAIEGMPKVEEHVETMPEIDTS